MNHASRHRNGGTGGATPTDTQPHRSGAPYISIQLHRFLCFVIALRGLDAGKGGITELRVRRGGNHGLRHPTDACRERPRPVLVIQRGNTCSRRAKPSADAHNRRAVSSWAIRSLFWAKRSCELVSRALGPQEAHRSPHALEKEGGSLPPQAHAHERTHAFVGTATRLSFR